MSLKNCKDQIENRTRDLPACSAVYQPTEPPRAPGYFVGTDTNSELRAIKIKFHQEITFSSACEMKGVVAVPH
jgi:hypothetical protein